MITTLVDLLLKRDDEDISGRDRIERDMNVQTSLQTDRYRDRQIRMNGLDETAQEREKKEEREALSMTDIYTLDDQSFSGRRMEH